MGWSHPVVCGPVDYYYYYGQRSLLLSIAGAEPLKVTWVRNNAQIRDCADFRHGRAAGGHLSLVIADIYPADQGFYFCEASNAQGTAVSHCHVTVIGEGRMSHWHTTALFTSRWVGDTGILTVAFYIQHGTDAADQFRGKN